MEFTIPAKALRAVELFAATQDVRYYLNGIHVRAILHDTILLTATNGHMVGQYRHTLQPGDGPYTPGEDYILPRDLLQGVKVSKFMPNVTVTAHTDEWTVAYADGKRSGPTIDGRFPDTDRIWPTKVDGRAGHFDFKYMSLIQKACDALEVRGASFFQNGPQCAGVFNVGQDFAGVLMPWKNDNETMPDWCKVTVGSMSERLTTGLAEAMAPLADNAPDAYGRCLAAVARSLDQKTELFTQAVGAETAALMTVRANAKAALWAAAKAPAPKKLKRRHLEVVA
jgi:hypothetical protein